MDTALSDERSMDHEGQAFSGTCVLVADYPSRIRSLERVTRFYSFLSLLLAHDQSEIANAFGRERGFGPERTRF
jgi:hypothetical protein